MHHYVCTVNSVCYLLTFFFVLFLPFSRSFLFSFEPFKCLSIVFSIFYYFVHFFVSPVGASLREYIQRYIFWVSPPLSCASSVDVGLIIQISVKTETFVNIFSAAEFQQPTRVKKIACKFHFKNRKLCRIVLSKRKVATILRPNVP